MIGKLNSNLDRGLVLHLPFTEGSGDRVLDRSPYGNNGTLYNSPTWTLDDEMGNCLDFDGTDDEISSPDDSSLQMGSDNFSLGCLVKIDSFQTGENLRGIVFKGSSATWGIEKYAIELGEGSYPQKIRIRCCDNSGNIGVVRSTFQLELDIWYHIFMTVNRTSDLMKLYMDGVLNISKDISNVTGTIDASGQTLDIGHPRHIDAKISNVMIYNRLLSHQEVLQLYNIRRLP